MTLAPETTTPEQATEEARRDGDDLLVVENLKKHFPVTRGIIFQKQIASVKAVDGVSFSIREGETLGVVGESGCGKSTMARCIMRLLDPTGGRVVFRGRDITHLSRAEMRPYRREMMMIFQDPYASLNPRKRVGFIVGEALEVHKIGTDDRDQAPRPGAARRRRPQPGALQPLPARVLGRPAPADRRRARARGQPEADRLRRARLGARRVGAGADPQPAQGPPARLRAHLRLHRARPQRRPPHLRPRDGHVPGQGRRGREPDAALHGAEAPVHGRAALRRADPGSRAGPQPRARSCSRATCRARSTRRTPAGSTRAARASTRATATSRSRSSTRSATTTRPPATTRSSAGR